METVRHPLRESAGVVLGRIDDLDPDGALRSSRYAVSSLRGDSTTETADEDAANSAFELEVIASLADPAVARLLAERGL